MGRPSRIEAAAEKRDGRYILNGHKMWITNGPLADTLVIYAKTDRTAGARGITAFIVEKGTDGLEFGRPMEKMGLHGSPTGEIILHGVFVSEDDLLGELNQGFRVAMQALDRGRIGISAQAIGLARGAMDKATRYAAERRQFGRPITDQEAIQFMIADRYTEIEAARLLTLRAATLCDRGQPFTRMASMAKLMATDIAMRATTDALQMFGGYGEAVRDPKEIAPALQRAREAVEKTRKVALINVWIDPNEYAPGTMNQTMYK